MSVSEVMEQVRKAEEEADNLLAEARRRQQDLVEETRGRGRIVIEEARRTAAAEIAELDAKAAGQTERLLKDLDRKALAEQEAVRRTAAANFDEARILAAEIFRRIHFTPRENHGAFDDP